MQIMRPERQRQLRFFRQDQPAPGVEARRQATDPASAECPFHQFTGDKRKLQPLVDAAFAALGIWDHECQGAFALHGSPTMCQQATRLFAEILRLPLVQISALSIEKPNDVLVSIARVCEQTCFSTPQGQVSLELIPFPSPGEPSWPEEDFFYLPPMIVFVDEIRRLPDPALRRLLKATDLDHPFLNTGLWQANCRCVCWMLASQDRPFLDLLGRRFTVIDLGGA